MKHICISGEENIAFVEKRLSSANFQLTHQLFVWPLYRAGSDTKTFLFFYAKNKLLIGAGRKIRKKKHNTTVFIRISENCCHFQELAETCFNCESRNVDLLVCLLECLFLLPSVAVKQLVSTVSSDSLFPFLDILYFLVVDLNSRFSYTDIHYLCQKVLFCGFCIAHFDISRLNLSCVIRPALNVQHH